MGAKADAKRRWLAGAILVMLASVLPGCGGHGSGGAGAERIGGAAVSVARPSMTAGQTRGKSLKE